MRLFLSGNNYKYAVEQILLTMFPEERPEYPEKPEPTESNAALIKLAEGRLYYTASVKLIHGGRTSRAFMRAAKTSITDKLAADRIFQKIIKLAFYKAAVEITGCEPAWGALTGIRPGKILTHLVEGGMDIDRAAKTLSCEYHVSSEHAELCKDTARASLRAKKELDERDIALYIGIPFCPTRCAYCSFVSHSVEKSMNLIEPFLGALYIEIEGSAKLVKELGLNVVSVYIGGGTPTTLSALQIEKLMAKLRSEFRLDGLKEYTVEAGRPDTITEDKLRAIIDGGATRVSINPQTMSDDVLRTIGRHHTADDVMRAFGLARRAGNIMINMDLIAGLPADSANGFKKTLDTVLALGPENVTVHTLAIKRGTKIMLEGTEIPNENCVAEMLDYSASKLRAGGYVPYYLYRQKFMSGGFENVGWSKNGCESLYNILIMEELCSILALGGGASTKLVEGKTGRIERIFNPKYPYEYIQSIEKTNEKKKYMIKFYRDAVLRSSK